MIYVGNIMDFKKTTECVKLWCKKGDHHPNLTAFVNASNKQEEATWMEYTALNKPSWWEPYTLKIILACQE